jgi:protein-tyrosine-phosphatase
MLAHRKKCLLLREKNVQMLQADLVGHLCYEFNAERIEETVGVAARRWLREAGIAKRPNEKLLVFVSSGGTCRDPMARAILLKLLEDRPPRYELQVRAAAVGPLTESKASLSARKAIQEMYGEDLVANHSPTLLTARMKTEADLILLMDRSLVNPKTLPAEKKKTFVFKEFFGLSGDIEDPWREHEDEASGARYAECAAELKAILENNLDRLLDFMRPVRNDQHS